MSYFPPHTPIDDDDTQIILKSVYPVGSILILTEPLMGKDRWEVTIDSNNYEDPELLVEWEGMTWEYLQSCHNLSQPFIDYSSQKHVLQNCHVHLHFKELVDDHTTKYTAALVPGPEGPAYHNGFYYDNEHTLTEAEIPAHTHSIPSYNSPGNEAMAITNWTWMNDIEPFYGIPSTNFGGLNGVTQPTNLQQHAYFVKHVFVMNNL